MLLAFGAVCALLTALTAVLTANVYPNLPDRVVLGLTWDSTPRSYGPKPLIWMLVVVQMIVLAIEAVAGTAIVRGEPHVHGTVAGLGIVCVTVTAALWYAQRLLIDASLNKTVSRIAAWQPLALAVTGVALSIAVELFASR